MGFSHSWIAVRGRTKAAILADLDLAEIGEPWPESFPPVGVLEIPGPWVIVLSDFEFANDERLALLSKGAFAVSCAEEEHVMASEAKGFQAGEKLWQITHDASARIDDLRIVGEPPAEFEAIRLGEVANQENEDGCDFIFDIAPKTASAVCGFQLGEGQFPEFIELRGVGQTTEAVSKGPGLFQRLFGKR